METHPEITGYFTGISKTDTLEKVYLGVLWVGGVAISCANSFWLDTSNTSTSIAPPKKSKFSKNHPKKDMHFYTTPQGQNGTAPLRPGSAPPVLQGGFFSPRGYPFSPSPPHLVGNQPGITWNWEELLQIFLKKKGDHEKAIYFRFFGDAWR